MCLFQTLQWLRGPDFDVSMELRALEANNGLQGGDNEHQKKGLLVSWLVLIFNLEITRCQSFRSAAMQCCHLVVIVIFTILWNWKFFALLSSKWIWFHNFFDLIEMISQKLLLKIFQFWCYCHFAFCSTCHFTNLLWNCHFVFTSLKTGLKQTFSSMSKPHAFKPFFLLLSTFTLQQATGTFAVIFYVVNVFRVRVMIGHSP